MSNNRYPYIAKRKKLPQKATPSTCCMPKGPMLADVTAFTINYGTQEWGGLLEQATLGDL